MQVKDAAPAQKNTHPVFVMEVNVHKFLTVSPEFHTTSPCAMWHWEVCENAACYFMHSRLSVKQWTRHILNEKAVVEKVVEQGVAVKRNNVTSCTYVKSNTSRVKISVTLHANLEHSFCDATFRLTWITSSL